MAVVVFVIGVIVALAVIPVSHSYQFTVYSTPTENGAVFQTFPAGASVSGSWSTSGGESVSITISCGLGQVYSGSGTSGSFSFTAQLVACLFSVQSAGSTTVTFTGSYSSPIL